MVTLGADWQSGSWEADDIAEVSAYHRRKRLLDIGLATLAAIPLFPIALLVALAVRMDSRGSILYAQERVGLDRRRANGPTPIRGNRRKKAGYGRPFTIYKFRTMYQGAENGTGAVWASADDPRITPVGKVLRQYRLDELPQLINVFRGDMNLVGPRPERPTIVTELRKEIPHYQQRHRTLPGITGHAQVNLQYDASLDDVRKKVDHDLEYLKKASAWEDFKIMIKTIPVMLFRRGSR